MRHRIVLSPEAKDHLRALSARDRSRLLRAIPAQLAHQPTHETHQRGRMRPNPLALWKLRAGSLRVYYDVASGPDPVVRIIAIGFKKGNRLLIGGKEVSL